MNVVHKARNHFQFKTKLELRELTGLKAGSIKDLLEMIRHVPDSVIYYHTHRFLQQHQFLNPSPPNDFSYWVSEMMGLDFLGEELASINTHELNSLEEIREKFIVILENFLARKLRQRIAVAGEEFHFIKSISFVFSTSWVADDLVSFKECLEQVSIDSFYFHLFEAKLRLKLGGNDFSNWLRENLSEDCLAEKIARLDPYSFTMEALRRKIIRLVSDRIRENEEGSHG